MSEQELEPDPEFFMGNDEDAPSETSEQTLPDYDNSQFEEVESLDD